MDYLSRLSGMVTVPTKAAAGITSSPRLRKKASLHPVGSVDVFHADWEAVKSKLQSPDERALFFGIARSDLPLRLQRLVDALVFESNRSSEGVTGACMEYLLKYDILTELVFLAAEDKPKGIKGETIRTLTNLIILLDEKFLSRQAVNKPISQLIQLCLDEDAARFQLDEDTLETSTTSLSSAEPDYNEDLVDLMCHIASRIRNTPDLLQIFFSDEPIDDNAFTQDVRSLKDGSILISREFLDAIHQDTNSDAELDRPPSPTGSVDSTATVLPSKSGYLSSDDNKHSTRKSSKRRLRFPLFSYLLKFIHREGRIGELARAGLLFLISLEGTQSQGATKLKRPLKKSARRVSFGIAEVLRSLTVFIAHSDFADVLGAGLGAAYGLLPSRVRPASRYDPTAVEMSSPADSTITLGSSSAPRTEPAGSGILASATPSNDHELQTQLRLVVDLLEFCQDILDSLWLAAKDVDQASTSATGPLTNTTSKLDPMVRKLAGAIAVAIRDTFIRNIVYPSLMESSDFDGSATAVLDYLDVIIRVLRNGHILTEVVLDFLLPSNSDEEMDNYIIGVPVDPSDRYSLKDLILDNMTPDKRSATRVPALRLATSLITCHGLRSTRGLLALPQRRKIVTKSSLAANSFEPELHEYDDESTAKIRFTSVECHLKEVDQYSSLLSNFGPSANVDKMQASLSMYLLDAEQSLRRDSTFVLAFHAAGCQVSLVENDPFIRQLFQTLAELFLHPVDVNLAATGVLSSLMSSPIRNLEGWLTYVRAVDSRSTADEPPALLVLLRNLASQVQSYRDSVPDFDRYLVERRRSLVLTEDITEALEADESFDSDEIQAEKDASNGRQPTSTTATAGRNEKNRSDQRPLRASLTLPNSPWQGTGGRLQTSDQRRSAERDFGIVQDRRKEAAAASERSGPEASASGDTKAEQEQPRPNALARIFGGRPVRVSAAVASGRSATATEADGKSRPLPGIRQVSSSTINPFTEHYRETGAVLVKAKAALGAESWRPEPTAKTSAAQNQVYPVTLSSVLDNTILLEELIKEIVAIIQVRRTWAIDPVVFA